MLRGQIDAIDEAIIRLVAERTRLSTRIQTARMNAGGTRVELGRERVILDAYRAGLGPDGPAAGRRRAAGLPRTRADAFRAFGGRPPSG